MKKKWSAAERGRPFLFTLVLLEHEGYILCDQFLLLPVQLPKAFQQSAFRTGNRIGQIRVVCETQKIIGSNMKILGDFSNSLWWRGSTSGHIVAQSALIHVESGGKRFLSGIGIFYQSLDSDLIIHHIHPEGLSRILRLDISKSLNQQNIFEKRHNAA